MRGERDETMAWPLLLSLEIFASIRLSVNLWSIEAHAIMSPVHLFMERSFLYSSGPAFLQLICSSTIKAGCV